jgi:hypothetical protein
VVAVRQPGEVAHEVELADLRERGRRRCELDARQRLAGVDLRHVGGGEDRGAPPRAGLVEHGRLGDPLRTHDRHG